MADVGHVEKEKTTLFILCIYAELFLLLVVFKGSKTLEGPVQHHALVLSSQFITEENKDPQMLSRRSRRFFSEWLVLFAGMSTYILHLWTLPSSQL